MHAIRIAVLEDAFRKLEFHSIAPFQIYNSWFTTQEKHGLQIWRNAKLAFVSIPHVITAAIGIVLFILQVLGLQLVQQL